MEEEKGREEKEDEGISKYLVASPIYVYALALVVLYEREYWDVFQINILEYATFYDLIRMALSPLISASVLFLVFVAGNINWHLFKKPKSVSQPSAETHAMANEKPHSQPTKIVRIALLAQKIKNRIIRNCILLFVGAFFQTILWLLKIFLRFVEFITVHSFACSLLLCLAVGTYAVITKDASSARTAFIFPCVILTSLIVAHTSFLRNIEDTKVREIVIWMLLIALPYCWLQGSVNAKEIKSGSCYQYISAAQIPDKDGLEGIEPAQKLRYVGRTTNYVFFYPESGNKTLIVRSAKLEVLVLNQVNDCTKWMPIKKQDK